MATNTTTSSPLAPTWWAIWYCNKAIFIPDVVIAQIRVALTEALGRFEEDLEIAWKHIFSVTQNSINTGKLPLDHPAWGTTPNLWWSFLTDAPVISEAVAQELNLLRRPLVQPYLDEFGWLVQERKGGNARDIELHGDVETRLDGFQGSTEEVASGAKNMAVNEVVQRALELLREFQDVHKKVRRVADHSEDLQWKLPDFGLYKINFDGALFAD
nr:hypothetical protein CFP56_53777 [Quercus suber]